MHRAHSINNIIKTLTEKQTFEQFIGDIYSPALNSISSSTSAAQASTAAASSVSLQAASLAFNSNAATSIPAASSSKKDNQDQF